MSYRADDITRSGRFDSIANTDFGYDPRPVLPGEQGAGTMEGWDETAAERQARLDRIAAREADYRARGLI